MKLGDAIKHRRIELGLRIGELARVAGLHPGVIERLEKDDEIETLSLRQLRELGDALGMDPFAELLRIDATTRELTPEVDDARSLGALIHRLDRPATHSELARALGWSLDRVELAARQLKAECERSGSRLVTSSRGVYISAAADPSTRQAARQLPRRLWEPVVRLEDLDLVLEVAECWDGRRCKPLEGYSDPEYQRIRTLINDGVLAVEEHFVTLSRTTAESLKPALELFALRGVARAR